MVPSGCCAPAFAEASAGERASPPKLYVTLREGRVVDTVAHDDREFAIDIGHDGQPIGYNIQFVSKHPDVIAEALQILQCGVA